MANKKNLIKIIECNNNYIITEDGKKYEFDCDVALLPTVDCACVTVDGKIWTTHTYGIKERKIKSINDAGYPIITLTNTEGKRIEATVHRIIWTAFIGEEPPYAVNGERLDLAHLDDNKWNASLENIALITHKLNCQATKNIHALDAIKQSRKLAKDRGYKGLSLFKEAETLYQTIFDGKIYY